MWTQPEAIELCKALEPVAAGFQCHVALTGGLLYKEGSRKDCDIIVYKAKYDVELDRDALILAFIDAGLSVTKECMRVVKATHQGRAVDLIFPECDGEYVSGEQAKEDVALATLGL